MSDAGAAQDPAADEKIVAAQRRWEEKRAAAEKSEKWSNNLAPVLRSWVVVEDFEKKCKDCQGVYHGPVFQGTVDGLVEARRANPAAMILGQCPLCQAREEVAKKPATRPLPDLERPKRAEEPNLWP